MEVASTSEMLVNFYQTTQCYIPEGSHLYNNIVFTNKTYMRSFYRTGSLKTVVRKLGKYKLDLFGVQEVTWEKGGTEWAEAYIFFYEEGKQDHQSDTEFFIHKRFISAIWRVEFINDRMLYIILRGCWCNIIILNVHASCKDKSDDVKDSFCKELCHVFDQFPRYDTKSLLGDLNAKVDGEDIFKLIIGNRSSHEISNDSGHKVVYFATSNSVVVRSYNIPSFQHS
jgi:hypothetical protein